MEVSTLHPSGHATVNALLNLGAAFLLVAGWWMIRRVGDWRKHRNVMLAALAVSALFLVSYLIYHAQVGSVPYPYQDWTRTLYFAVLIPHVILAALMVPFIVVAVVQALRHRFEAHRKIVRWVWPTWLFVSLSGVAVYLMLYRPLG
jgi:uncharacterized membrane protein YozB (DUF420 family)